MNITNIFSKAETETDKTPSIIKDPFIKDKLKGFGIRVYLNRWGKDITCIANVDFANGNTEGKQNFETNDFEQLMTELNQFFKSFEK